MVGRIRFALERFGSPRHSSHVAQLWSLGIIHDLWQEKSTRKAKRRYPVGFFTPLSKDLATVSSGFASSRRIQALLRPTFYERTPSSYFGFGN